MTRWFDKVETEEAFDGRIAYMERISNCNRWDSSIRILIYLQIHGELGISELQNLLQLKGEKSIYKSLKVLINAEMIAKITDPNDKRKTKYKISEIFVHDPRITKNFLQYLVTNNKQGVLTDYMKLANTSSVTLVKVMSEVMSNVLNDGSRVDDAIIFLESSIFFEAIISVDDHREIIKKINKFLEDQLTPYLHQTVREKKLENPAGIFLTYMPLKA